MDPNNYNDVVYSLYMLGKAGADHQDIRYRQLLIALNGMRSRRPENLADWKTLKGTGQNPFNATQYEVLMNQIDTYINYITKGRKIPQTLLDRCNPEHKREARGLTNDAKQRDAGAEGAEQDGQPPGRNESQFTTEALDNFSNLLHRRNEYWGPGPFWIDYKDNLEQNKLSFFLGAITNVKSLTQYIIQNLYNAGLTATKPRADRGTRKREDCLVNEELIKKFENLFSEIGLYNYLQTFRSKPNAKTTAANYDIFNAAFKGNFLMPNPANREEARGEPAAGAAAEEPNGHAAETGGDGSAEGTRAENIAFKYDYNKLLIEVIKLEKKINLLLLQKNVKSILNLTKLVQPHSAGVQTTTPTSPMFAPQQTNAQVPPYTLQPAGQAESAGSETSEPRVKKEPESRGESPRIKAEQPGTPERTPEPAGKAQTVLANKLLEIVSNRPNVDIFNYGLAFANCKKFLLDHIKVTTQNDRDRTKAKRRLAMLAGKAGAARVAARPIAPPQKDASDENRIFNNIIRALDRNNVPYYLNDKRHVPTSEQAATPEAALNAKTPSQNGDATPSAKAEPGPGNGSGSGRSSVKRKGGQLDSQRGRRRHASSLNGTPKAAEPAKPPEPAEPAEPAKPNPETLIVENIYNNIPTMLVGKLRNYQLDGLSWLIRLYNNKLNGILADEMGLGKTIQTIALLIYLRENKVGGAHAQGITGSHIIVAPLSTLHSNWKNEFEAWCPSFRVCIYEGSREWRKTLRQRWFDGNKVTFDILLTSDTFILKDKNYLKKICWEYLIIDEAHRFKNSNSTLIKILNQSFIINRRLLLTGTPIQNNIVELWTLLNFVKPQLFNNNNYFNQLLK